MGSARLRRGASGVPPDYIATQLRMKQMGRALSHDGVQYYHPTHHDDEEEDAQYVSLSKPTQPASHPIVHAPPPGATQAVRAEGEQPFAW
ncbi:hypothetical protein E2C01_053931 [Portunus trituberculatus]|uniref:Uncharacterized protein n=1 Tax=Portunus trituberculatus TaxID=210409 RepID=A0A5B7GLN1_PORTR|nr:hypothetical protein [Portunus trituberculatus]